MSNNDFADLLDDTVTQHPIGAFQMFAEVEEGGDYMEQFAELLNAISTNVVVPVEDEDELDEFADLAGQRVFGQIDGEDGIVFSEPGVDGVTNISRMQFENGSGSVFVTDTEPDNPSQGDEWYDTTTRIPSQKVFVEDEDGNGVWRTISRGENPPDRQTLTISNSNNSKLINVEDIHSVVEVVLEGQTGDDGVRTANSGQRNGTGEGGFGGKVVALLNLRYYDEIELIAPYQSGSSGGYEDQTSNFDSPDNATIGGDGGDSVAIFGDGEELIVACGGGGGGAFRQSTRFGGQEDLDANGGDGGGVEGGNGGSASSTYGDHGDDRHWYADDGEAGGVVISNDEESYANISIETIAVSNEDSQGQVVFSSNI